LIGLVVVTVVYLTVLAWVDARGRVFEVLPLLASVLPLLLVVSLFSYLVRFLRWHWLLGRAGSSVPFGKGFVAYLAGFAFTATPGKAGELIRIRYYTRLGVPPSRVLAVFVYERAFDLLVVLSLAVLCIQRPDLLILTCLFTFLVIGTLILLTRRPVLLDATSRYLESWRAHRLAQLASLLRAALEEIRVWMQPRDVFVAAGLGLVAWGASSVAFVYLLDHLGISLPIVRAVGIYPLSMMAGAASMLPGGLGSTEATIVALLSAEGVELSLALLAAVGIRLATLWFAIICGLVSMAASETLTKPCGSGAR
jgi:uncharacterized protein (TIRG00374 family)